MKNPSYYVFFDVDGTLLREKSLFEFLQYFYKVNYGKLWKIKYKSYLLLNNFYDFLSVNRSWINQNYHKQYKGHQQNKIDALGYEWFFYIQNKSKHLFNMDVIN
jgi:FMN phosphatase YigB (HAD superfamily)